MSGDGFDTDELHWEGTGDIELRLPGPRWGEWTTMYGSVANGVFEAEITVGDGCSWSAEMVGSVLGPVTLEAELRVTYLGGWCADCPAETVLLVGTKRP